MIGRRLARILGALLGLSAAGCAALGAHPQTAYAPTLPPEYGAEALPVDGSIYSAATSRELFADPKARRAGDILTIVLVEQTQANNKSSTTTSKNSSTDLSAPTLLGRQITLDGRPLTFSLDGNRGFDGEGETTQSNQLTGAITVTVARRLPNGALVVRGEKWLHINQGQELVQIAGIVRPQDIGPDNSVPSTRVADARIAYTGRGTLADSNAMGWLARFFNSKWMPF